MIAPDGRLDGHTMIGFRSLAALSLALAIVAVACGSSDAPPSNTGQACTTADQCFAEVEPSALKGTAICLDKVPGGYCTHSCSADSDCCAAPGECRTGLAEVCGPFESTNQMVCFVSCESAALEQAGYTDSTAYCAHFANPTFTCRSTGGGANNRKVCVPN